MSPRQPILALLAVLLSLLLAGCDRFDANSIEALEAKAQAQAAGERQAELEYLSRQAAVASGCGYLFDPCPESLTRLGHEFIERGNIGGGGDTFLFWAIVLAKMLMLGALAGAAWLTARMGWIRIGRPAQRRTEAARVQVQTAEKRAAELLSQAQAEATKLTATAQEQRDHLDSECRALESDKESLLRQIQTLTAKATQAQEQAQAAEREAKRLRLAARAAANFD